MKLCQTTKYTRTLINRVEWTLYPDGILPHVTRTGGCDLRTLIGTTLLNVFFCPAYDI